MTRNMNGLLNNFLFLLPLIPLNIVLPEIISGLAFFVFSVIFTRMVLKKQIILCSRKNILFVSLLFILSLISVLLSKDRVLSFLDTLNIWSGLLLYLAAKNYSPEEVESGFRAILYGGMASSVLGIILYLVKGAEETGRLEGMLNYANTSALFFGIYVIIYFSFYDKKHMNRYPYLNKLGVLSIMTALYLTQSRGGFIVYVLALVYLVISSEKQNREKLIVNILFLNFLSLALAYCIMHGYWPALMIILPVFIFLLSYDIKFNQLTRRIKTCFYGLAIVVFFIAVFGTFRRLADIGLNSPNFQIRLVYYEDSLNLIFHNLLGIGAGRWSTEQFIAQTAEYNIRYIHNGFLQIAADFGILFFALLTIFVICHMVKPPISQKYKSVYFLIILMILLHSCVDFSMSFLSINVIFFLCLAMLSSSHKLLRNSSAKTSKIIKPDGLRLKTRPGILAKYCLLLLLLLTNIISVALMPGELVNNLASFQNDTGKKYNTLMLWHDFPVNTSRYSYDLAVASYKLYTETRNNAFLETSFTSIQRSIRMDGDNPVNYALLGRMYFGIGNYDEAAQNLELSISKRKYFIPTYDALLECYYAMYKDGQVGFDAYADKVIRLTGEIEHFDQTLNRRARGIPGQPQGELNDYESMRLAQVKSYNISRQGK